MCRRSLPNTNQKLQGRPFLDFLRVKMVSRPFALVTGLGAMPRAFAWAMTSPA
jgi:hypothetical protein